VEIHAATLATSESTSNGFWLQAAQSFPEDILLLLLLLRLQGMLPLEK
jgi:hypothetical protein